ncbi:Ribosomal protein S18 acetylase RimI [Nocardioides terrae]|uniref:Ribosomal protein S18 acetylase RimI n=1 Tax=Nocardioides terrae TaxID=574651 RepID=A0A1I1J056_9ACTN|nr:GNAT family N-acetyltransferase [Nocardioides terrae]SFC41969.1 Ribosomal protein S18 acetylase RimI [Nocardioides terrae]
MAVEVRRVRAEDWQRVRAMRLEALQDEVASIAFVESHARALVEPDSFWQERTTGASAGDRIAQFVAIDGDDWVASAVGVREQAGAVDWSGRPVKQDQVHVVGVWVRPDRRGAGLLGRLVDEIAVWAAGQGIERLRLLVHEDNARARAAYGKLGFVATGVVVVLEAGNELEMRRP